MATKKVVIKKAAKKEPVKETTTVPVKETKESKLVKLLSGKEAFTAEEVMKKTGFSAASANMYLSQAYLDRKEKPYKVIIEAKGGKQAFRYEAKGKGKGK